MMRSNRFRFRKNYFFLTLLLFAIEIGIAIYINDAFVRPYLGDFLVVMLLYCFFRSFLNTSVTATAFGVLIFAYAIEAGQYFNIVTRLGLEHHHILRIAIGSSFEWADVLVYTLGTATIVGIERFAHKKYGRP